MTISLVTFPQSVSVGQFTDSHLIKGVKTEVKTDRKRLISNNGQSPCAVLFMIRTKVKPPWRWPTFTKYVSIQLFRVTRFSVFLRVIVLLMPNMMHKFHLWKIFL